MILIMTPIHSYEYELLEAYCLGKGKLWNLFFGWRKTVSKDINGEWAYFKLSRKKYYILCAQADDMKNKNFIIK